MPEQSGKGRQRVIRVSALGERGLPVRRVHRSVRWSPSEYSDICRAARGADVEPSVLIRWATMRAVRTGARMTLQDRQAYGALCKPGRVPGRKYG